MSINIELNPKQLAENLDLHYLPAKINGDGAANVDNYFNNYTHNHKDVSGVLCNSLRGFPLLGEKLDVPTGYKGIVVQETDSSLGEHGERQLRITGVFDKFTYWNYDKIPTKADAYKQALQHITIAEALAAPVSEDEIEKELKRDRKNRLQRKLNYTKKSFNLLPNY